MAGKDVIPLLLVYIIKSFYFNRLPCVIVYSNALRGYGHVMNSLG